MDDQNDSHDPTKLAPVNDATTTPTETSVNADTLQSNDVIELQAFLEVCIVLLDSIQLVLRCMLPRIEKELDRLSNPGVYS